MTENGITKALGQHLIGAGIGLPIIWANEKAGSPPAPYLVAQIVPTASSDFTFSGTGAVNKGFMQVTVVSGLGGFATAGLKIAEDIKARFAYPTTLTGPGLEVTIIAPPFIGQGYDDGVYWRTPVRISYSAINQ